MTYITSRTTSLRLRLPTGYYRHALGYAPPSIQYISHTRDRLLHLQDILLITGSVLIFGNQVTPLQVFGECRFPFFYFYFLACFFLFSFFVLRGAFVMAWFLCLPALWRSMSVFDLTFFGFLG